MTSSADTPEPNAFKNATLQETSSYGSLSNFSVDRIEEESKLLKPPDLGLSTPTEKDLEKLAMEHIK